MEDKEMEKMILDSLKRYNVNETDQVSIINDIDSKLRDKKWRKEWSEAQKGNIPYPHF